MKKMRNIFASILCLSLLLLNVRMDTKAETRASNITYGYLTKVIQNTDIGGNVTVKLRVSYLNTGAEVILNYVTGASYCTATTSNVTCSITNDSYSGYSSSISSSALTINFDVELSRTNGYEKFEYAASIVKNNIVAFGNR